MLCCSDDDGNEEEEMMEVASRSPWSLHGLSHGELGMHRR